MAIVSIPTGTIDSGASCFESGIYRVVSIPTGTIDRRSTAAHFVTLT